MPLPLIPVLLLGSSAIAAAKGIYDAVTASQQIPAIQEAYTQRRARYEYVEIYYREHRCHLERRMEQLGKLRLEAMVALGEAVIFLKKAHVRERDLFEELQISQEQLAEWEGASLRAIDILSGVISSAGAGVATASGVYGLVGALGIASTGTAIATLSGAAATNATLAWLGGGALAAGGGGMALGTFVLGGLVTGPALLITGLFVSRKVEEVRTDVSRQFAEMDIAESQMEYQLAEFKAIDARISEVEVATGQAQHTLRDALIMANPENFEEVFIIAKLAKSLANILDIKVLP